MICPMSLAQPPADLPPHLVPLWPWIWFQRLVLVAWIRAVYGRGTQFHWGVNAFGMVLLCSIDHPGNQKKPPEWLAPAAHPNDRIAATLDGRLFSPAYARLLPVCPDRRESWQTRHVRRQESNLPLRNLPLPES